MNRSSCHGWIKPPLENNLLSETPNARSRLPSYECFVGVAPEAPCRPKQYRPLQLLVHRNEMGRPITEDATALTGTELQAFFLLTTLHNAERCCTGCWERNAIKSLSQLWASYAAILIDWERCAHWYNRGTAFIGVTKHFLLFLSECECIPCTTEDRCLVL